LQFRFYPLRFEFIAKDSLFFPPGKASNILRGALGVIFRKIACVPHCEGPSACDLRDSCPYARLFEPASQGDGPSGLADWPRPFVFRARHLDGRAVSPGEAFSFDLNVFSLEQTALAYFVLTFSSLAREGLGPKRGRADLRCVMSGDRLLYDSATQTISSQIPPQALDLAPVSAPAPISVDRIAVTFLSPTELKHEHRLAETPEFPILFARIRDRVSTLSRLYADSVLDIDYPGTSARAANIRLVSFRAGHDRTERRSSRTGQRHLIGGFIGEAEYEGDLAEFLPWLEAARYSGVGRQSVWGKGEIAVHRIGQAPGPIDEPLS
jgi:hypothetical protein